jgi:N-methylhydantoinase B
MGNDKMNRIRLQVMWDRLLSVVEGQAQTLVRTAFSTSTREAGDVSAGVFDLAGRMLAQAVTGTPGHINSMARAVVHFMDVFPVADMNEGDVYITNDPWRGTGHLHDFTVVTPAFRAGRIVALFACTSHVVDIGGIGQSPEGRQVYHEGLFVPIMPLALAGEMNSWLLNLIRANVREPIQVEGDIYALAACNEIGAKRLFAMMDENDIETLDALGAFIIDQSHSAITAAINALPQGRWSHSMRIDGYSEPIDLVASLTIANGRVHVDYEGSSGVSEFGINCPMCYTEAYTAFGVKCVVAPDIPNNAGTLDAITVCAPEHTIVNAPHPCAVVARSTIGHMLPDVVFGCLHQALPERVPAEGTSNLWNLKFGAGHGITSQGQSSDTSFMVMSFHSGGAGARPHLDGLSATPYPSGVRNVPVEITEAITPIVIWRKELRIDSGGAGAQRGGLGQSMLISNREGAPTGLFATFERVHFPACGRDGGGAGACGVVALESGKMLRNKGFQIVPGDDRLVIEMPGGGGYGDPLTRDPEAVANDVALGFVSVESAAADYGVVLDENARVDVAATQTRRQKRHIP